jgi:hypothetical protein
MAFTGIDGTTWAYVPDETGEPVLRGSLDWFVPLIRKYQVCLGRLREKRRKRVAQSFGRSFSR